MASAKTALVSALVDANLKELACKREERLAKKRVSDMFENPISMKFFYHYRIPLSKSIITTSVQNYAIIYPVKIKPEIPQSFFLHV